MAYRKKTTARRTRGGRSGYSKRAYTARRTPRKRSTRSRSAVQTVRIVVEQPQAVSSLSPIPQGQQKAGRKAIF